MAIGMTYEQYWYGDVWLVEAFREADRLKQERANHEFWLQGMYFFDGTSRAVANVMRKKGSAPEEYPAEPYSLFRKEKTEEEKERDAEQERVAAKLYMQNMVRAGKTWGKN